MKASVIALITLAAAASAIMPARPAVNPAEVDPTKRATLTLDDETKAYVSEIVHGYQVATGHAGGVERRQFEVCPLSECQDRCNFAPPLCIGEFCDWNVLGCLAGCCVACGGC